MSLLNPLPRPRSPMLPMDDGERIVDMLSLLVNNISSSPPSTSPILLCQIVNQNCSTENIGMRYTSVQNLYIVISILGIVGNALAIAVIMKRLLIYYIRTSYYMIVSIISSSALMYNSILVISI